jgi:hypothetical protein
MKKILLGSIVLTAFSLSIILFQMTSCKKATAQPTPTTYSIQGLWIGTYTGNGSSAAPQYFSLIIKPDGNVINETQVASDTTQYLNVGTWQLSGNTLTATYTNVYGKGPTSFIGDSQTATATFNASTGTLTNGTWTDVAPLIGSGAFTLTKVN